MYLTAVTPLLPQVPRPTIRVARGLVKEPSLPLTNGTKRKALATQVTLPVKKARPSVLETEQEMKELDKEVRALQWLARRKEQEWEQCVRLLKQKEERLLRCQRNKVMCLTETEHLLSKLQPVVVPQQQVLVLNTQPSALRTPARTIAPKPSPAAPTIVVKTRASPVKQQQQQPVTEPTPPATPSGGGETKFSHVLEKAGRNLAKATKTKEEEGKSGKKEKVTPPCQGCGKKKSEFVCAGCSNRWYCSRECQVTATTRELLLQLCYSNVQSNLQKQKRKLNMDRFKTANNFLNFLPKTNF